MKFTFSPNSKKIKSRSVLQINKKERNTFKKRLDIHQHTLELSSMSSISNEAV